MLPTQIALCTPYQPWTKQSGVDINSLNSSHVLVYSPIVFPNVVFPLYRKSIVHDWIFEQTADRKLRQRRAGTNCILKMEEKK